MQGSLQLITDYMATKGPKAAAKFKEAISLQDAEQRTAALEALSNSFNLGDLFRDMQAMSFIRPALMNQDKMQGIQQGAAAASGGINADWQRRMDTAQKQMDLFEIRFADLKTEIGQQLMPVLGMLAGKAGAAFQWMTDFAKQHPGITKGLVVMGAALSALLVVVGSLLAGFGTLMMFFGGLLKLLPGTASAGTSVLSIFGRLVTQVMSLATRAFPMLLNVGRALPALLGGISWPVLAIGAAVVLVAALVWKYWGPIKAFMIGVWQGLQDAFAPVLAELRTALAPLAPLWDTISAAMGEAWGWIKRLFAPFQATSEQLQGLPPPVAALARCWARCWLGNCERP